MSKRQFQLSDMAKGASGVGQGTRAQYCFPAVALELQQQQFALVGRCQTRSAVASGL